MIRRGLITICLLLLVAPVITVRARDLLADTVCIIEENATITGAVFAFCEELYINGTVNGDVFAATVLTEINGTVNGSIYSAGGQLDVYGQITQDIHFAGASLELNAPAIPEEVPAGASIVETVPPINPPQMTVRSIKSLTLSTIIHPETQITAGIIGAGYQLIIGGDIENEINFWGSTLIVNGLVDGNVFAVVGDPASDSSQIETLLLPLPVEVKLINPGLIVGETGEITGLLSYQGPAKGTINGTLTLEPQYVAPEATVLTLDEPGFATLYLEALGSEFSTLLIIGIFVVLLGNNFLKAPVANLRSRPFASGAVGMLGFLLSFPVVLIILVLSLTLLGFLFIIGFRGVVIAIALVLGLVNIGVVSIFYFVAIFVTRALVGLAIGRFILRVIFRRTDVDDHRYLQFLALATGVLLLASLISLPVVGIIVNALSLFLGLGAVMIVASAQFERLQTVVTPTGQSWYTPSSAIIREHRLRPGTPQAAIPMPESTAPASLDSPSKSSTLSKDSPGTDNLPEGFDWDFFED